MKKASIVGMEEGCRALTISDIVEKPVWRAETKIPEGAVKELMVPECIMLGPRPEDNLSDMMVF